MQFVHLCSQSTQVNHLYAYVNLSLLITFFPHSYIINISNIAFFITFPLTICTGEAMLIQVFREVRILNSEAVVALDVDVMYEGTQG